MILSQLHPPATQLLGPKDTAFLGYYSFHKDKSREKDEIKDKYRDKTKQDKDKDTVFLG